MVNTPVLFETFVRVDYARQVWDAIKAAQPKKLYFYSNKGRAEKEGEIKRNNEIRSWVKEIDWDCELHTCFRDECVDVYTSLRGAISWLFENEETGIVLEDDCVPTKAFFSFCDQMLKKYSSDQRVWYISGDQYLDRGSIQNDFVFSHYHWLYGWASWRDRWQQTMWGVVPVKEFKDERLYENFYKTRIQAIRRYRDRERIKDFVEKTECWDYCFNITADYKKAVGVYPAVNLITNIGMQGTHADLYSATIFNKPAETDLDEYVIANAPADVCADKEYDYNLHKFLRKYYAPSARAKRLLMKAWFKYIKK